MHACSVMLHFICSVCVAVLTGLRESVSCKHCLVVPVKASLTHRLRRADIVFWPTLPLQARACSFLLPVKLKKQEDKTSCLWGDPSCAMSMELA